MLLQFFFNYIKHLRLVKPWKGILINDIDLNFEKKNIITDLNL